MSYSSEEIQTAVEKLINGSIRRPLDTLGVRRTDVTFSDVQAAAAGVFILNPLAPFYAVLLGSKRLLERTRAEATLVGQLRGLVGAVGRRVLPVADVESLFNAKAALQQLESAVSKQAPRDITKLPAFQRFALNVQDFLTREGSKVKDKGDIIPTPQEARQLIPGVLRELVSAHATLLEDVTTVIHAIDDYNAVNLPSLVAKGVVSKAREVLGAHADELEGMLPEERLIKIRSVVLDVLAAKSVVQKFGSNSGLTTFVQLSGTGLPYADATHPATPAAKTSDWAAPFSIYGGVDSLGVFVDGAVTADVLPLNNSLQAVLLGIRAENEEGLGNGFIIGDGISPALPYPPPNNNELKFTVTNLLGANIVVTVPLTLSALSGFLAVPRTAQQVCDDINTALVGAGLSTRWLAEPYFYPATFLGTVNIENSVGATADFVIPAQAGGSVQYVKLGNLMTIAAGPNAGLWTVTALVSSTKFSATKASGVATNETLRSIEVGDAKRAVRIRAIDPAAQISSEEEISYTGDSDKNKLGATTLGFNIFARAFCRPSTGQQVADDLNVKLPKKLNCTTVVTGMHLSFRTEPGTFLTLVSSKLLTVGNVVYTPGMVRTVVVTVPSGGILAAGVVVGDYCVLRGGTPPATSWLITAVTDTSVMAESVSATAINGTGVTVEFGTRPPVITRWKAIDIPEGVLQGRYYVKGEGKSVLDIVLQAGLTAMQNPATRTPLTTMGTLGDERVVIRSRSTAVSSQISVDDSSSAAIVLFSSPSDPAYGSSPWFQLPSENSAVDTGDQLETYLTDYASPSNVYAVTSVAGRILGINPEMPSNASWSFNDQPPPFAKIRNGTNLNFAEFKGLLEVWLAREVNQTVFFRDLNRFLNPLLENATPTAAQIGTALNALEMLLDYLIDHEDTMIDPADSLQGAIEVYKVDPVPGLDTLLRSLVEKGADRAVDTLLAGRFSEFFSMDVSDVSYSGAMQKGMRLVVQNDLPVRSTKRFEATQSRLLTTSSTPDYEFTFKDSENVGAPDIPADYDDTPR